MSIERLVEGNSPKNMHRDRDIPGFTDEQVCDAIAKETKKIMEFWKNNSGWAPAQSSEILTRSMLDWQISLAEYLETWLHGKSEAQLILAWVNLGALVEGMLKLFLCVYYQDYAKDEAALRKKGKLQDTEFELAFRRRKRNSDRRRGGVPADFTANTNRVMYINVRSLGITCGFPMPAQS
jgi:hypothetical protein